MEPNVNSNIGLPVQAPTTSTSKTTPTKENAQKASVTPAPTTAPKDELTKAQKKELQLQSQRNEPDHKPDPHASRDKTLSDEDIIEGNVDWSDFGPPTENSEISRDKTLSDEDIIEGNVDWSDFGPPTENSEISRALKGALDELKKLTDDTGKGLSAKLDECVKLAKQSNPSKEGEIDELAKKMQAEAQTIEKGDVVTWLSDFKEDIQRLTDHAKPNPPEASKIEKPKTPEQQIKAERSERREALSKFKGELDKLKRDIEGIGKGGNVILGRLKTEIDDVVEHAKQANPSKAKDKEIEEIKEDMIAALEVLEKGFTMKGMGEEEKEKVTEFFDAEDKMTDAMKKLEKLCNTNLPPPELKKQKATSNLPRSEAKPPAATPSAKPQESPPIQKDNAKPSTAATSPPQKTPVETPKSQTIQKQVTPKTVQQTPLERLNEKIEAFKQGIVLENKDSISKKQKGFKQALEGAMRAAGKTPKGTKEKFEKQISGLQADYKKAVENEKNEVKEFIGKLDGYIKQNEDKLEKFKLKLNNASNDQEKRNLGKDIKTITEIITTQKAIKTKLEEDGQTILRTIRESKTQEVKDAKNAIKISIEQGDKEIKNFANLAEDLIARTTGSDSKVSKKILESLDGACSACRQNLEACKQKEPMFELFGLMGSWRVFEGELYKPEENIGDEGHMNRQVMAESRLNSTEILPNFAESFHKEIMMGQVLQKLNLEKPGLGDLSVLQKATNLQIFQKLTGESDSESPKAQALNDAYTELWSQYKARGLAPQKYLEAAKKFLDLFHQGVTK